MKWNLLIALVALTLFVGCEANNPDRSEKEYDKPVLEPVEYGQGVYYFNCNGRQFAESFVRFRKENNGLRILTIATEPDVSMFSGYFVVTDQIPPTPNNEGSETVQVQPDGIWAFYRNPPVDLAKEVDKKAKQVIAEKVEALNKIAEQ